MSDIQIVGTATPQPNKLFSTDCGDHILYEYYLVGNVGDPEDYMELCHALRSSRPEDVFVLRINSGGGQVRSGNQIINALEECEAQTIGFIEHDCGSMATFLFLKCKSWGVSKYAEWFSHTVSGGNYGKENETFEASQFLRKQTHKRIREDYKHFFNEDEIESLLKGTDIYLNADEVMERLEVFSAAREKEFCTGEYFEPQKSLEVLIKESVVTAVDEAMKNVLKKFDLSPKAPKQKAKKAVDTLITE